MEDSVKKASPIPVELNIIGYPMFFIDKNDRSTMERGVIEYNTVVDVDGKPVSAQWRVTANIVFGLPTQFDREVHKVIEKIISEMDFPVRNPIPIPSLKEFCRLIGKTEGGENVTRIKEAFERLSATTIQSNFSFQIKEDGKRRYVRKVFHLYDGFVLKGELLPDGTTVAEQNYLLLGQEFLQNINQTMYRLLDYTHWRDLENPTAQRLYEILGGRFFGTIKYNHPCLRMAYSEVCALAPLKPRKYLSQIKQQLEKAIEILIRTRFLEKVLYERDDQDEFTLYFYPGHRARLEKDLLMEIWKEQRARLNTPDETLALVEGNIIGIESVERVTAQFQTLLPLEVEIAKAESSKEAVAEETKADSNVVSGVGEGSILHLVVKAFHKVFHGVEKESAPTESELQAARDIILDTGIETREQAEECMEYVKGALTKGDYRPAHIKGIRTLVTKYGAILKSEREQRDQEEREARLKPYVARYEQWKEQEYARLYEKLPEETKAEFEAQLQRDIQRSIGVLVGEGRHKYPSLEEALAKKVPMALHVKQMQEHPMKQKLRYFEIADLVSLKSFEQWLKDNNIRV